MLFRREIQRSVLVMRKMQMRLKCDSERAKVKRKKRGEKRLRRRVAVSIIAARQESTELTRR
jgi:hypothetical protein